MDQSAIQHMEKLLREDTAGEFEIQGLLGRGGMAVVFLAREIKLARKVAIKVLPPELTFGHGVDRFLREAKTAALLDHPNIIPIYRIGSGGKLFWYAMKYLEGRSLDDLMKEKGRVPLDVVIPILDQVADALDYAHAHNVIHRDMKPANVMLDARNRVIVTDFGIAKALTEQTLTASGSVVGTPYYMSPEQGMGTGVSGRSDQYSVAVMAYRMLSGQFPFEGDTAIDILHKHCMIPPSPLEYAQPGLPRNVYLAIHKALEKKPERRFSTVAAFVEGLQGPTAEMEGSGDVSSDGATIVAAPSPRRGAGATPPVPTPAVAGGPKVARGVATPPTPAPRPSGGAPERPERKRVVLIAGALLVLGGGGLGAYLLARGGPATPPDRGTQQVAQQSGATEPAGGGVASAEQPGVQPSSVPEQPPASQPVATRPTSPPEAAAPPAAPRPTTGTVDVIGLPTGGLVALDGRRERGTSFSVPAGPHRLEMGAPGYERVSVSITVRAGERNRVPYTGRPTGTAPAAQAQRPPAQPAGLPAAAAAELGFLQVVIGNGWANVAVDGQAQGRKTRFADTLLAGAHQLSFQREDFLPLDTIVTVQAGETTRIQVTLKPRSP
jgi:serine/threonine-protein kinase